MAQLDDRVVLDPPAKHAKQSKPMARRPVSAAGRLVGAVLFAGLTAVVMARWWWGTGYEPAPPGLPDPGQFTAITLPVTQFVHELSGIAVVGLLLLAVLSPRSTDQAAVRRLFVLAGRWSWVLAGSTAAWIAATMSDMTGLALPRLLFSPDLVVVVAGTQRILAEVATLWVALALALFADRLSGRIAAAAALLLAIAALLPSSLSGHAGHHNVTTFAVAVLAVHVAAAALWVGGLFGMIVHLRGLPAQLGAVLPRFSAVALVCAVAVGISGVFESVVLLGSWPALLESDRGQMILAKAAALVLLVGVGFLHRRSTMARAASGNLLPLLRLAAVELLVMGGTIGLAVALSTTP